MGFLESIFLQISDSLIYQIVGVVVAAIVGILIAMKKLNTIEYKREQEKSSPLQILKERYARGEISDEEFDRKKKKLSE